jgi:hypothetical protein
MIVDIQLKADIKPLEFFVNILNSILQIGKGRFNVPDLAFELVRIEFNNDAAGANELIVIFYPSDTLLRLVSALCTGDFDFKVINKTFGSHSASPFCLTHNS